MSTPRIHATPPEAIADTARDPVFVDGHTFRIDRPADSDGLIDHPAVRAAYAADGYLPYWSSLWPSARMLAKAVVREPWGDHWRPAGVDKLEALEVGCGLGLAGVAALSRGLRVTFSDVDETALTFAARNARLNGFADFRTVPIDFRAPPADVKYPVVLGSDLMYEERMVGPLIGLLRAVLDPNGVCLITDPDRGPARVFRWKLAEAGFDVSPQLVRAGEPGGERVKGTLYRIRFAADA